MKKTSRVFVLTVQPSSRSTIRVWTGKSLHALRLCSTDQINAALAEMQHSMDAAHVPAKKRESTASYSINRSR